jgi:hypothetical protein
MSTPAKPVTLNPQLTYLHVTSPQPHSVLSETFSVKHPDYRLHYVGPVGELKGEHIFEVHQAQKAGAVERDSMEWKNGGQEVLQAIKAVEGVKGVKVLEVKQRAKRDEF